MSCRKKKREKEREGKRLQNRRQGTDTVLPANLEGPFKGPPSCVRELAPSVPDRVTGEV